MSNEKGSLGVFVFYVLIIALIMGFIGLANYVIVKEKEKKRQENSDAVHKLLSGSPAPHAAPP